MAAAVSAREQTTPAGTALEPKRTPCEKCPLRQLEVFREFSPEELKFVSQFKSGELVSRPGVTLLLEGSNSPYLYTVLSGWLFRYKALPDGRRQILNFALPGDFVGLQASVFNEMQHTVETLTDVVLCTFPRDKLWTLYAGQPGLGFDITWLAAREEKMLDDHLLSIGRRTAIERAAYLILHLCRRSKELGLSDGINVMLPINQQHVADALGMSLVHTNKTLRKLYERKLIRWKDKVVTILKRDQLAQIARVDLDPPGKRPLI